MPKKTKSLAVRTVEVLSPAEPDIKGTLERMVERKIAEMMGDSQNGIFEPFFQAKAIIHAIRKLETIPQQRKWQYYYFEEWAAWPVKAGRRDINPSACASRATIKYSLGLLLFCAAHQPIDRSSGRHAICRTRREKAFDRKVQNRDSQ